MSEKFTERMHRYLDGELEIEALSESEIEQVRGLEEAISALALDAARFEDSDLAERVMNDLSGRKRSALGRFARWWVEGPRISFTLRPVYAALLLLLVGIAGVIGSGEWTEPNVEVASQDDPTVFVRFELSAPDAESVQLAGSFSNWSPEISLQPVGEGLWTALVPLHPGVHDYAFQVNGDRWVLDPYSPRIADGFGGFNSRLSLVVSDS